MSAITYLIEQCVEFKMSRSIAAIKQLNSNVILFITFKKNEGLSSGYLVSNFDDMYAYMIMSSIMYFLRKI